MRASHEQIGKQGANVTLESKTEQGEERFQDVLYIQNLTDQTPLHAHKNYRVRMNQSADRMQEGLRVDPNGPARRKPG